MAEEVAQALDSVAGGWDWSNGVSFNTALVFVRPNAVKEPVKALVRSEMEAAGLTVMHEGTVSAEEIANGGVIDKFYASVATHAMEEEPGSMPVPADRQIEFEKVFEVAWSAALSAGTVMNAKMAMETMAQDGEGLLAVWEQSSGRCDLGKGCVVARCTYKMADNDEGDSVGVPAEAGEEGASTVFIVNGFYGAQRQQFLAEGASVQVFVVGFTSDKLSWSGFLDDVIGAADPEQAAKTSIRAKLFDQWEPLGLAAAPTVDNNGVHASIGAIEGLQERLVWLGLIPDADPFGQKLLEVVWGDSAALIDRFLANEEFEFAGKTLPIFDLTAAKDSLEALCICNNLAFATPEETKEFYGVEEKGEEGDEGEGEGAAEEAAS